LEQIIAVVFWHENKSLRVSDQRKAILDLAAPAVETPDP
jgi:hypothetical protein